MSPRHLWRCVVPNSTETYSMVFLGWAPVGSAQFELVAQFIYYSYQLPSMLQFLRYFWHKEACWRRMNSKRTRLWIFPAIDSALDHLECLFQLVHHWGTDLKIGEPHLLALRNWMQVIQHHFACMRYSYWMSWVFGEGHLLLHYCWIDNCCNRQDRHISTSFSSEILTSLGRGYLAFHFHILFL